MDSPVRLQQASLLSSLWQLGDACFDFAGGFGKQKLHGSTCMIVFMEMVRLAKSRPIRNQSKRSDLPTLPHNKTKITKIYYKLISMRVVHVSGKGLGILYALA